MVSELRFWFFAVFAYSGMIVLAAIVLTLVHTERSAIAALGAIVTPVLVILVAHLAAILRASGAPREAGPRAYGVVDPGHRATLERLAKALRTVADLTGKPEDIAAAAATEAEVMRHRIENDPGG